MATTSLDEKRIKELYKQAMMEFFEEQRDIFYALVGEVIKDTALVNAM